MSAIVGLCAAMASNAENVSIWWRHHEASRNLGHYLHPKRISNMKYERSPIIRQSIRRQFCRVCLWRFCVMIIRDQIIVNIHVFPFRYKTSHRQNKSIHMYISVPFRRDYWYQLCHYISGNQCYQSCWVKGQYCFCETGNVNNIYNCWWNHSGIDLDVMQRIINYTHLWVPISSQQD